MRTYGISQRAAGGDWSAVPALPIDNLCGTPETDVSASAQLCYTPETLFVRLAAVEKEIRAEETGPLGMPCEDSCLEFFFSPMAGDTRYLNFEFNPNACLYLGIGSGAYDLVRLLPDDPAALFSPKVSRTGTGWEITYGIPAAFVRRFFPEFTPKPGKDIRANCFKCGDLTARPHYLSWSPVTSQTPSFHRPEDFGRMTFA